MTNAKQLVKYNEAASNADKKQYINLRLLSRLAIPKDDEKMVSDALSIRFVIPKSGRGGVIVSAVLDDTTVNSVEVGFSIGSTVYAGSAGSETYYEAISLDRATKLLTDDMSWENLIDELGHDFMTELRSSVNKFLGLLDYSGSEMAKVDTVYLPGSQKEKMARKRNASIEVDVMDRISSAVNRLGSLGNTASISGAVSALSLNKDGGEIPLWINGILFARMLERLLGKNSNLTTAKRSLKHGGISGEQAKAMNLSEISDAASSMVSSIGELLERLPAVGKELASAIEEINQDDEGDDAIVATLKANNEKANNMVSGELAAIQSAASKLLDLTQDNPAINRFSADGYLFASLRTIARSINEQAAAFYNNSQDSSKDMERVVSSIRNSVIKSVNDANEKLLDELNGLVGHELAGMLDRKVFKLKDFVRKGGRSIDDLMEVNAEKLKDILGVAGIEWGVSVGSAHSKILLKAVASSWRDVADVLGVDDKGVSLGGKFVISLGARGGEARGAKAFHQLKPNPKGGYTPVLVFTKENGDGSFAHELYHAIDHNGERDTLLEKGSEHGDAVAKAAKKLRAALISCPADEFVERRNILIEEATVDLLKVEGTIVTLEEEYKKSAAKLDETAGKEFQKNKAIFDELRESTLNRIKSSLSTELAEARPYIEALGNEETPLDLMIYAILRGGQSDTERSFREFAQSFDLRLAPPKSDGQESPSFKTRTCKRLWTALIALVKSDDSLVADVRKYHSLSKTLDAFDRKLKNDKKIIYSKLKIPAYDARVRTLRARISNLKIERDKATSGVSLSSCSSTGIPKSILREIMELGNGLYPSRYLESSVVMDDALGNNKKPYLSNAEELGARAFEVYVASALRKAGRENAYLSKTDLMDKIDTAGEKLFAYLTGTEKDRALEAIDELLARLRESGFFDGK